jgi:hypothetical protein
MFNFNLFENINLKFFCFGAKNKHEEAEFDKKIFQISKEEQISILPIVPTFDIENLYPLTDHVHLWNIFIIGNDKTYILANIKDPFMHIPEMDNIVNKQGQNILPSGLFKVFDGIWTKTLSGKKLQFYMVWNSRLYFVNTYPFLNGKDIVIGACLFMRSFETITENNYIQINSSSIEENIDNKSSIENGRIKLAPILKTDDASIACLMKAANNSMDSELVKKHRKSSLDSEDLKRNRNSENNSVDLKRHRNSAPNNISCNDKIYSREISEIRPSSETGHISEIDITKRAEIALKKFQNNKNSIMYFS